MKTLATAIAAIALALPMCATAQAPTAGSTVISANGHAIARHGWLTTSGPDTHGAQSVSISLADLDTSSAAGRAKVASRIEFASAVLCDLTADGPQFAGYYDGDARRCRAETRAAAMARLGSGQHALMITVGTERTVR